jgi:hypothetical protein
MNRSKALSWLDSAVVFAAMCGAFIWQWLTPEYRVLKPVRVGRNLPTRRPPRSEP